MSVDCSDLLTAAVQAILNLAAPSSAAQILPQMQALCPTSGVTLAIAQTTLDAGVARGVLNFCVVDGDPTIRYEIRNDMLLLRWDNTKYWYIVDPSAAIVPACST